MRGRGEGGGSDAGHGEGKRGSSEGDGDGNAGGRDEDENTGETSGVGPLSRGLVPPSILGPALLSDLLELLERARSSLSVAEAGVGPGELRRMMVSPRLAPRARRAREAALRGGGGGGGRYDELSEDDEHGTGAELGSGPAGTGADQGGMARGVFLGIAQCCESLADCIEPAQDAGIGGNHGRSRQ